jgi:hypothetical protein
MVENVDWLLTSVLDWHLVEGSDNSGRVGAENQEEVEDLSARILWLFGLSINGRRFLHFLSVRTLAAITTTVTATVGPTIRTTLSSIGNVMRQHTKVNASRRYAFLQSIPRSKLACNRVNRIDGRRGIHSCQESARSKDRGTTNRRR